VWVTTAYVSTTEETRVARFFLVKRPKRGEIIPKEHKIYQMAVKYFRWPANAPTFSNLRPSKTYPNWDFWYEKYTI
jgi:hypothetical protein